MSRSSKSLGRSSDRYRDLVGKLDQLFETGAASSPVYSSELAERLAASIRTLQSAVRAQHNMSLHSYVRWKRLITARQKLQQGMSVKRAALESGFWHMGEFARDYRNLFGELPSALRYRTERDKHARETPIMETTPDAHDPERRLASSTS
jgi:AraC family ethanolamine operon transcriptional activator